jgi:CRISPR-associated protein Cmr3
MNQTITNSRVVLALSPRDGMLLKDGRGWSTSESGRAGTFAWPAASTVRGAITAATGHVREDEQCVSLSPDEWLSIAHGIRVDAVLPLCGAAASQSAWARLWPAPRDAATFPRNGVVQRLDPSRPDKAKTLVLSTDSEAVAIEALWHPRLAGADEKPDSPVAWWPEEAFVDWLCGRDVLRTASRSVPPPPTRVQTHVSIGSGGGAVDGGLFTATVIEPVSRVSEGGALSRWPTWSLAAIGTGFDPRVVQGRTVRLGGDGLFATCAPLPDSFAAAPPGLLEAFRPGSRGLRLVLVGDASFAAGWRPGFLEPREGRFVGEVAGVGAVVLRAACVGRPVVVSGWAMAGRRTDGRRGMPKPSRRLAPAGSVFFLEKVSGEPFTAGEAESLWLRSVGESVHGTDPVGAVVPGVWNPDHVLVGEKA